MGRLDQRALGEALLDRVRTRLGEVGTRPWHDSDEARLRVALSKALYLAGRISRAEFVLFALVPVEGIHDHRWSKGHYSERTKKVEEGIDKIRAKHGLTDDEYWPLGTGPKRYHQLSARFDAIHEETFDEVLREFDLAELADLRLRNRKLFDQLRERGRRSKFHGDEIIAALKDIVVRHESDARKAAHFQIYSAAVTLLAAGLEGLLLLRCLQSEAKARRVAQALPVAERLRNPKEPMRWSFDELIRVCLACGWLPAIDSSVAQYSAAGLAHWLRSMRNAVHPGRQAREKPWIEVGEEEYKDAKAIYDALLMRVLRRRARKSPGISLAP